MQKRLQERPAASRGLELSVSERMAMASKKFKEARERKMVKAKKSGIIPSLLLTKFWVGEVTKLNRHYPCIVTKRDIYILQSHAKMIHLAGLDAEEYLRWAITSWAKVLTAKFGWMNDRPQYPSIRFLIRFKDEFQAAYANRDSIARQANMTPREKLVARKVDKGMDPEVAERQVEMALPTRRRIATVSKPGMVEQANKEPAARKRTRTITRPAAANAPGSFGTWEDE